MSLRSSEQTAGGFIAIICGLKSEAAAVRDAVGADGRIHIGVSGADARRAETIARGFCTEGTRAILSVGVSGGLDPALRPGDLVVGETVVDANRNVFQCDLALLGGLHTDYQKRARLFGADSIIDSVAAKAELWRAHGAAAVDMESHGCAKAAAAAGIPFLAIRAIADPSDRALPSAAMGAVAPDGSTRVLKTLGAALRAPQQFPELMKLGADSAAATRTLRRELRPIFQHISAALDL